MAIVIYAESENGKFKKTAFELASYGRAIADQSGTPLLAVTINQDDNQELAKYGVDKVIKVKDAALEEFTVQSYAEVVSTISKKNNANIHNKPSSITRTWLRIKDCILESAFSFCN